MKIDRRFISGEPLERWFAYADDFECLFAFPEPAEWRKALGDKPTDAKERAVREFLATHVKGWRGLEDDNGPIPFDTEALLKWADREPPFAAWLVQTLADAASFRRPAGDCAAAPVRHEGEAADA